MYGYRQFLLGLLLIGVSHFASAVCTITVNTGSSGYVSSGTVAWTGCSSSGTGLQGALNRIQVAGPGTLQFSGTGGIDVGAPLTVHSSTTIVGNSAIGPYGTPVIADPMTSSCSPGGTYRSGNCPIFQMDGSATGISITYLDVNGDLAGKIIEGAVFLASYNVNGLTLSHNRIVGPRNMAIGLVGASNVTMDSNYIEMRMNGTSHNGGAGVWCVGCTNVVLKNGTVTSPQYYNAGAPNGNTMDLIAFYGGYQNQISGNTISYGNTAAVYLATCPSPYSCAGQKERYTTVWNNTIAYFQQHGLDFAGCDHLQILTNYETAAIGLAGLSLYECTNANVQYNIFEGWTNPAWPIQVGVVMIYGGSTANSFTANYIYGNLGHAQNAVMFGCAYTDSGLPASNGNSLTNNDIWKTASVNYFNAYAPSTVAGNTTTPNNLH